MKMSGRKGKGEKSNFTERFSCLTECGVEVKRWCDPKWPSGNSALTRGSQRSQQPSQSAAIAMVTADCFL